MTEPTRDEVAIVGMAGRFPGAGSVDGFWENLRDGVESVRAFTPDELSAAGVDPSKSASPGYVPAGAPLDDADMFDASFFGYTRREAEVMDPQHRVFLECAWAALEDAGYDTSTYQGRIGMFGGVAPNTYRQQVLERRRDILDLMGRYPLLIGSEREYAITRTAFKLGLNGPAISVGTACSTSAVALHLACQSILSGECDMAIVGGARIAVPLTAGYVYEEDGILSPDGHCRTFDAAAKGTVVGSGAAIVVIKRMSDALRDGDTIRAVVKGSAVNNDGSEKIGFTAPERARATVRDPGSSGDGRGRRFDRRIRRGAWHGDLHRRSHRGRGSDQGIPPTYRCRRVLPDRVRQDEHRSPGCGRRRRGGDQGDPGPAARTNSAEPEFQRTESPDRFRNEPVPRQ